MFVFFEKTRAPSGPDFSERARNILEEISKNTALREAVLLENENEEPIRDFIETKIREDFLTFEVRICEIDEACGIEYKSTNVYSAERIISSTIDTLNPKKIRLFIWEK